MFQSVLCTACYKSWKFHEHPSIRFPLTLLIGGDKHHHSEKNERDGVSNHRRLDGLLIRLFRRRPRKTSNLRVTGLCEGKELVTGEFLSRRINDAENDDVIMHKPTRVKI